MARRPFAALVACLVMCACCAPSADGADGHAARLRRRQRVYLFPQEAPNDPTQRGRRSASRARRCSSSRRPGCSSPAALDLRANSHDQVEDTLARSTVSDRGVQRPRLSLRRLTATLTRGPFTVDVGKQFIRWGKADIVTPTDRFAPRDFLNVIDTEFLAGDRRARRRRSTARETFEAVWVPRFTPSRMPLLDQRWTAVPPRRRRSPLVDAGAVVPGRLAGRRSLGPRRRRVRVLAVVLRRLQPPAEHRRRSAPGHAGAVPLESAIARVYPAIRTYGGGRRDADARGSRSRARRRTSPRRRRAPTSTCSTSSSSSGRPANGCSSAAMPAKS